MFNKSYRFGDKLPGWFRRELETAFRHMAANGEMVHGMDTKEMKIIIAVCPLGKWAELEPRLVKAFTDTFEHAQRTSTNK